MRSKTTTTRFIKIFIPISVTICIALIVLSTLFFHFSEKIASNLITETYTSNLTMISTLYKQMRFNSVPVAAQLFEDPTIQNFLFHRLENREAILRAIPIIDRIVARNSYIHSIYLYNEGYGFISSSWGYEGPTCTSDPSLLEYLKTGATRTLLFDKRRVSFSDKGSNITLHSELTENLYTLATTHFSDNPKLSYALVVNFSESAAREMFTLQAKDAPEDFYIINNEGYFLSHPQADQFSQSSLEDPLFVRLLQLKANAGSIRITDEEGKQFLACWNDQTEMGWRLIYLIPYEKIVGPIEELKNNIIRISLITLILSLLMLVLISKRLDKSLNLEKRLLTFLKGEGTQKSMPYNPTQDICFAIIRLGNLEEGRDSEEICSMSEKAVEWILPFLRSSRRHTFLLYLENHTYCYLSYQSPAGLKEKITQANALVKDNYGFDMTSIVLAKQYPLEELPAKIQQVRKDLRVLYLYQRGSIVSNGDILQPATDIPMADTNSFVQALKTSDVALYEKEVAKIFEILSKKTSYEYFLALSLNLGLLIQQFYGAQLDLLYPGGSVAWYTKVLSCEEYSQLHATFASLTAVMEASLSHATHDQQKELVTQMKKFIEENLQDKCLNAALVADQFCLSVNYARVKFKQNEGVSLNEAISSRRLARALVLLEESDLAINEIRDQVGFGNYSYFCTYFKNMKGMSPATYRTFHRKNKNS